MSHEGKYRMYAEAPIGTKDQGPMSLWEADTVGGRP